MIAGCISLPLFTYCSYYHWGHIALLNTEVLAIIDFQSDFYHLFLTILINDYRLARAIYSTDLDFFPLGNEQSILNCSQNGCSIISITLITDAETTL